MSFGRTQEAGRQLPLTGGRTRFPTKDSAFRGPVPFRRAAERLALLHKHFGQPAQAMLDLPPSNSLCHAYSSIQEPP